MLLVALQHLIRPTFNVTAADVTVGVISGLLAGVCVLFHYEVMSTTSRMLSRVHFPQRLRIVVVILAMLIAHVVEVWIFALSYWGLYPWEQLGTLPGIGPQDALAFVYYSVVTYTTLGLGDIIPVGAIRILTGTEALVGLALVTWSASFAFLEMQRNWAEYGRWNSDRE